MKNDVKMDTFRDRLYLVLTAIVVVLLLFRFFMLAGEIELAKGWDKVADRVFNT